MQPTDIQALVHTGRFPHPPGELELVETHISWLLLGETYAYKIKKPIRYSFLDFSTLAQRRYYCEEELRLNRRLAPEVYRRVLPIFRAGDHWSIGGESGDPVEYCVEMHRLPAEREMTRVLERGEATASQMEQLAGILADFHQRAERIEAPLPQAELEEEFADLAGVRDAVGEELGSNAAATLDRTLDFGAGFWSDHYDRYRERVRAGYRRDCHGDLHAGNIFLTDPPVIFDCIEFSADFRQIDILDELAFLAMDLERYGRADLSEAFLQSYRTAYPAWQGPADEALLHFYKVYRCNVKVKVQTLKAQQATDAAAAAERWDRVRQYLKLLDRYLPA